MTKIPLGSLSITDWQRIVTNWALSKGFTWTRKDIDTMLLRTRSEISEASEAIRDNDVEGFGEELADTFIRFVNLCEVWGINLEEEVIKKTQQKRRKALLAWTPQKLKRST